MNQTDKITIGGSICGPKANWQPWNYSKWIRVAEKVAKFKATPKDTDGKQRPEVTKLITEEKSRQEFVPPLGKYVDLAKAEPLHKTNNAWQHWFLALLTVAMQYSDNTKMKPASVVSDLPNSLPLVAFLKCIRETVKCARLCNSINRWFSENSKKGISLSYRFTVLESKRFSWNFAHFIEILLQINKLSSGSVLKVHTLAFIAVQIRDANANYSRVDVSNQQVEDLKGLGQKYFTANPLLLDGANPTLWTVGYAIPYHTSQLFKTLGFGFGLGLNSMQRQEAKQVKLAKYVENTCNVKNSMSLWIVLRHEFVCLIWLWEMDPYSVIYYQEKEKDCDSYVPKRVKDHGDRFCYYGLLNLNVTDEDCMVCTDNVMKLVKQSVFTGKVNNELKQFLK